MSRFLVVYGTTDGHAAKIASHLATTLRDHGATVTVLDTKHPGADPSVHRFDGVIVAASIHIGNYQRTVKRWVRAHAQELNRVPSAFVSVCLGILEQRPGPQQEVRAIAERLLRRSGWEASVIKTVAGALPYTRYNWLKKLIMKRIAARAGNDTDTTRDYEYTNWDDLRAFAESFADRVEHRTLERVQFELLR